MDLVWRPFGLIATTGGLLAWLLAALLLARPGRAANRRLAAALFIDGTFFLGYIGLPYFTLDSSIAFALIVVGETALMASAWFYLSFLGTLETPLTRPFRRFGPAVALVGTAVMVTLYRLWVHTLPVQPLSMEEQGVHVLAWAMSIPPGTTDGQLARFAAVYVGAFVSMIAASLYGIVASLHAWLRAEEGSPAQRRNRLTAIAFAFRDGGILIGFGGLFAVGLMQPSMDIETILRFLLNVPMAAEIVFVPLVVYAILRAQVFGIELTLKAGIPKGLFIGVLVVGFVVVSEIIEEMLTQQAGVVAGIATAAAIGLAFRPIERIGMRLADRALPHVEATEAYRAARRAEVYRDAFEAVVRDGRVLPHEEDALASLAERLAISDTDRTRIEDAVRPALRGPPGHAV